MSILADTNVLLRRTQPSHPSHRTAVDAVAKLLAAGEPVYFTLQNISEFWNVLTRPIANNGLGFSAELALREVEKIERLLLGYPRITAEDIPEALAYAADSVAQESFVESKAR